MLLRFAADEAQPQQRSFTNDAPGRQEMIDCLQEFARRQGAPRSVLAYEASGQGFGLSDLLEGQGIECHVLSPTHLAHSAKSGKLKTDARDAQRILEALRGHVLAGNALPAVWTPPARLRDDRELVRARIDAADEATRVKLQLQALCKRRGIEKPKGFSARASKAYLAWLRATADQLDAAVRPVLEGLVLRLELFQAELVRLDRALRELSQTERCQAACRALTKLPGVGLLSALTFLTELGDLTRFHNRRELAAYLGLCPASYESGETNNRKGRITRQGPGRLRKVLCQAAWVSLRCCGQSAAAYQRLKQGQAQRSKKALTALMRQLAIRMWHTALACGVSAELAGRGGPHACPAPPQGRAG